MHPDPVAAGPDVLEDILLRLLPCFIASFLGKPRLSVLKNDSAAALPEGVPGPDAGCVMPWESEQRRKALDAYRTLWPPWKTRLPS